LITRTAQSALPLLLCSPRGT